MLAEPPSGERVQAGNFSCLYSASRFLNCVSQIDESPVHKATCASEQQYWYNLAQAIAKPQSYTTMKTSSLQAPDLTDPVDK